MKKKMHQVLAAENEHSPVADKVRRETKKVFERGDLFEGFYKTYSPLVDDDKELLPPESKELVTSVAQRLVWNTKNMAKAIDVKITKDEGNASGTVKADLILNGQVIGTFASTTLLTMEKIFRQYRDEVVNMVPTLDLTKKWNQYDKTDIKGAWISDEEVTNRERKDIQYQVVYEATEHHPADVRERPVNQKIGTFHKTYLSGKASPVDKAEMLTRIDTLISAIVDARQRANDVAVEEIQIAEKLFDFVHGY